MLYKAFISYSHAADNQLAPMLQTSLQRFAKPFYRLRALRVFRDKTSLHLTPELWPAIQQALHESEFFLLLASQDAARSEWVQKEIDEWLTLHGGSVSRLLIILTDGEILWDAEKGDFDWQATTALPPNLKGRFAEEPLFLDFRWARSSQDLSLRHPQFLESTATIAAALHGKPKDAMIGEDVRAHRLFRLVSAGVTVALLALTVAAFAAAYVANEQSRVAHARQLLAESELAQVESESDTASWANLRQRSFLLTVAAVDLAGKAMLQQTAALDRALRSVARSIPRAEKEFHLQEDPRYIDYSSDGRRLIVGSDSGISIRDARFGREIGRVSGVTVYDSASSWTPEFSYFAGGTSEGPFRVWRFDETIEEMKHLVQTGTVVKSAFSANGEVFAVADDQNVLRVVRTTDGRELVAIAQPEKIDDISVDAAGAHVATVDEVNRIRVYTPPKRRPWRNLSTESKENPNGIGIFDVTFSQDGKLLAGASYTTVVVWDLAAGAELQRIRVLADAEDEAIIRVAFSADSRAIGILTDEGWVALYDLRTGEKIWPGTTSYDWWTDNFVVDWWSFLGTVASRDIPNGIELWDWSNGRKLACIEQYDEADDVAYNAENHSVAVVQGQKLRLIDVNPGDELAGAALGLPGEIEWFVSSADGQTLVGGTDAGFGIWSWGMSSWWKPPQPVQSVTNLAVSRDGTRIALWSDQGLSQWLVDHGTGEVKPGPALRFGRESAALPVQPATADWEVSMGYSKNGRYLAALTNGRWYVWSSATGEQVLEGPSEGSADVISFDRTDRSIWYEANQGGAWAFWAQELPTKKRPAAPPRRMLEVSDGGCCFMSPAGRYVVIRRKEKKVLWDTQKRAFAREIQHRDDQEMWFAEHDRFVVIGNTQSIPALPDPNSATIYDLEDGRRSFEVAHDRQVREFAFSGDGSILATADYVTDRSEPAVVHLTDMRTGKELGRISFVGPVYGMALSGDGRRLCVYGKTGAARVWDLAKPGAPVELAQFHHGMRVRWAEFDASGENLMTIDGDVTGTRTHKWIISVEKLLSRIRAQVRRDFTPDEREEFFRGRWPWLTQKREQDVQHPAGIARKIEYR